MGLVEKKPFFFYVNVLKINFIFSSAYCNLQNALLIKIKKKFHNIIIIF